MERPESVPVGAVWSWSDLKHPIVALTAVSGFLGSAFVSQVVACNMHELGHAVAAIPLGWEVQRINWCAPGAGSVEYAHVGDWAWNLQGYSGGVVAALLLFGAYQRLFAKDARPLEKPWRWAAGLGVVLWIGPQLVIAVMEGSAGPNEDYTELFRTRGSVFVPLILVAALTGVGLYIRRWSVGSR
jgi:hypothetical protein